jgi:hypothetical protein
MSDLTANRLHRLRLASGVFGKQSLSLALCSFLTRATPSLIISSSQAAAGAADIFLAVEVPAVC